MTITVKDLQSLDIFFAPKRSVSDIEAYLEKTEKLHKEAKLGSQTALVDISKLSFLDNVTDYEWNHERFKEVCRYLDLKIIEENNPKENVITLYGDGEFMVFESLRRHCTKQSNPKLQYNLINRKIKFQKENS